MRLKLTYLLIFSAALLLAFLVPKEGGYVWQPELINPANAALFTLLVFLTARVLHIGGTVSETLGVAVALLLLSPTADDFILRAEDGFLELFSMCIVPFFMSQYNRIHEKNFRKGYILMFLMGIFCSYTHDGVSLPLCFGFVWLSYRQRKAFFRRACWPMVVGFCIGTVLSLASRSYVTPRIFTDLNKLSTQTATALSLLWDTKVFIFTLLLTAYFLSTRQRMRLLFGVVRKNRLIASCFIFALCLVPFSPLGLEKSVTGVCFFGLLWFLLLAKRLVEFYRQSYLIKRQKVVKIQEE